jgi:hypothetical protein
MKFDLRNVHTLFMPEQIESTTSRSGRNGVGISVLLQQGNLALQRYMYELRF